MTETENTVDAAAADAQAPTGTEAAPADTPNDVAAADDASTADAAASTVLERYELPAALAGFDIAPEAVAALDKYARANGLSQDDLDDLVNEAVGDPAAKLAELQAEFGERTGEMLRSTAQFAEKLGAAHGEAVAQLSMSPAGVKLLNSLRIQLEEGIDMGIPSKESRAAMNAANAAAMARGFKAAARPAASPAPAQPAPSGKKTEAELQSLMKDPRYWHAGRRDPAFVAEVDRGFQQLYPGVRKTAPVTWGEGT